MGVVSSPRVRVRPRCRMAVTLVRTNVRPLLQALRLVLVYIFTPALASAQTPVFRATTNLQSIAVQGRRRSRELCCGLDGRRLLVCRRPVHFQASGCEVSAQDHPYPWQLKSTLTPSHGLVNHEDFCDPRSGWPNRGEERRRANIVQACAMFPAAIKFRATRPCISPLPASSWTERSQAMERSGITSGRQCQAAAEPTSTSQTLHGSRGGFFESPSGLVFHLNNDGYYVVALSGGLFQEKGTGRPKRIIQFLLGRRLFNDDGPSQFSELIPLDGDPVLAVRHQNAGSGAQNGHTPDFDGIPGWTNHSSRGGWLQARTAHDDRLRIGLVGMAVFGKDDAIFPAILSLRFAQESAFDPQGNRWTHSVFEGPRFRPFCGPIRGRTPARKSFVLFGKVVGPTELRICDLYRVKVAL